MKCRTTHPGTDNSGFTENATFLTILVKFATLSLELRLGIIAINRIPTENVDSSERKAGFRTSIACGRSLPCYHGDREGLEWYWHCSRACNPYSFVKGHLGKPRPSAPRD